MPRFFDDYSNTYLTHDSSAGRKQQRRGWKFRENFKMHYGKHKDEWLRGSKGMGLAAAQQGYIKAVLANNPPPEVVANLIPPLPAGWKEEKDDVTGLLYYIEIATKQRTWVRPGFIPPPPPSQQAQQGGFRGPLPPPHCQHRGPPPPQQHHQPPPPAYLHPNAPPLPPPPPPPHGLPPPPPPPPPLQSYYSGPPPQQQQQ